MIAHTISQKVGPEGDVQSLDVGDERVEKHGYNFQQVTNPRLPFEDKSFDIVLSNHVIEHVGDLPERAEACVEAYAAGLGDEGVDVPLEQVRRGHAVSLMLFNGLPSLPIERLQEEAALEAAGGAGDDFRAGLDHWARQRSGIARYALDVLQRTA